MRKVMLCDADARLFGEDILPLEVEFYHRHLGAFKQMWPSQGKKFWLRVVITFRWYTVNHGVLKDYPEKHNYYDKYNAIFDQMLIYVHDQIVSGRLSTAKNLISDIITLAANRSSIQHLCSKSFAKDPFYYVETRETFRRLFGERNCRMTILKVYLLFPIFLKLGGALVRLIRQWMDAVEELSDSDDFYWLPNTGNIYRKIETFDEEDPPDFDSYIESLYPDPTWYTFPLPRNMSCVGVSKENGFKKYEKKPRVWWFYPYAKSVSCDDYNTQLKGPEPPFMREIDMHVSYLEIGVLEKVMKHAGNGFKFEFRRLGKDLEKDLLAQAIEKERLAPWSVSETDPDRLHSILAKYFTDILKKDLCSIALLYRHPQDKNECKYLKIEKKGFLCVDPEKKENPEGIKQTIIEAIAYAVKDLERPFCPENAVYWQNFSTFCATAKPIVYSRFKELLYGNDNSKPLFPDAPNSQYCFRETCVEEAIHQKIDLHLTHSVCPVTGDVQIFEEKDKATGSDRSNSKKKNKKKKKAKASEKVENDFHRTDKTDISCTVEKGSSSQNMHPVLDQAVESIVQDVFDKIQEKGGIQMKQTAVAGKFRRKEGTYDLQVTVEAQGKDGANITSTVEQRVDLRKKGILPLEPNSKFAASDKESESALNVKPKPAVISKELKVTKDNKASLSAIDNKQLKHVASKEEPKSGVDAKQLKPVLDKKEDKSVSDDKATNSFIDSKNATKNFLEKKPTISNVPTDNRTCATCRKTAPPSKKYRKCQRCRDEGVLYPRHYCSRECQSMDWQMRHLQEHKEDTLEKKNQES